MITINKKNIEKFAKVFKIYKRTETGYANNSYIIDQYNKYDYQVDIPILLTHWDSPMDVIDFYKKAREYFSENPNMVINISLSCGNQCMQKDEQKGKPKDLAELRAKLEKI